MCSLVKGTKHTRQDSLLPLILIHVNSQHQTYAIWIQNDGRERDSWGPTEDRVYVWGFRNTYRDSILFDSCLLFLYRVFVRSPDSDQGVKTREWFDDETYKNNINLPAYDFTSQPLTNFSFLPFRSRGTVVQRRCYDLRDRWYRDSPSSLIIWQIRLPV